METKAYLNVIWQRKWIIVATIAVTMIVVVVGTLLVTPTYQASTTLRVKTASEGSLDYVTYDVTYGDRLMNTYAKIITSGPLLTAMAQKLGPDKTLNITTATIPNSELMQIIAEDQNPVLAAKAANTMAEIFTSYIEDSQAGTGTVAVRTLREQPVGSITVIEPAAIPTEPSSPRMAQNVVLGSFIGLLGGLGLAFLIEIRTQHKYSTLESGLQWQLPKHTSTRTG